MTKRKTIIDIKNMKNKEKISALTCYSYFNAKIFDEADIDIILIGDSIGNVVLGYDSTLPVEIDDIIYHAKAINRGNAKSLITADMPFMSYQSSHEDAIRNAGALVKYGNVNAVKVEGGEKIIDKVKAIIDIGIPVMGHLGLTPQSVNAMGGYKVQATKNEEQKRLIKDALALQKAGVFSIVLECIPEELAKKVTEKLAVPTIGIGSGKFCDGQILVFEDMVGMTFGKQKKFVKQYADVGKIFLEAAKDYKNDVKNNRFPDDKNVIC